MEGYVEGFYSIFDNDDEIEFRHYQSDPALLNSISDMRAVERLKWFSKGFYKVHEEKGEIIISDLRMGVEPQYFFRFSVGKRQDGKIVEGEIKKKEMNRFNMRGSLVKVWERIWNEEPGAMFTD